MRSVNIKSTFALSDQTRQCNVRASLLLLPPVKTSLFTAIRDTNHLFLNDTATIRKAGSVIPTTLPRGFTVVVVNAATQQLVRIEVVLTARFLDGAVFPGTGSFLHATAIAVLGVPFTLPVLFPDLLLTMGRLILLVLLTKQLVCFTLGGTLPTLDRIGWTQVESSLIPWLSGASSRS